jgi:hypothetical protein
MDLSARRVLDEDELAGLERLSDDSEFFQSILDDYWTNGELTPKQYAVLVENLYG